MPKTCTCIKETEDQIPQLVASGKFQIPKNTKFHAASCENVGINFSKGTTCLTIPFKLTWEAQVKGRTALRSKSIQVIATHCPFCGKPLSL